MRRGLQLVQQLSPDGADAIGPLSTGWSSPRNRDVTAYEAKFICRTQDRNVEALITTTWRVTAPAKTTRIRYESGAELVLDHTAVAGYFYENGHVAQLFGTDGSVPRRDSHYQALDETWLIDGQPLWFPADTWRPQQLLL